MEIHRRLIAELSHFVSWLRRLGIWFFCAKPLWLALTVGLVLPAFFLFGLCERVIRTTGVLREVGGIITVI